MNLHKKLAIFSLFLPVFVFPQHPAATGYYISSEGRIISGTFPGFKDHLKNPSIVKFVDSATSHVVELSVSNCQSFSITHVDRFIAYRGRRLTNSTNWQDAIPVEAADSYENIFVFLRVLFDNGQLGLYELVGDKRVNYYVSVHGNALQELYYKVTVNENGTVIPSSDFKRQLSLILQDLGSQDSLSVRNLEDITYDGDNLADLFRSITGSTKEKKEERFPMEFFGGAGVSINHFRVTPGLGISISGNYKTQTSPLLELGIKMFNQRNSGKWFLVARLNYYRFENSNNFTLPLPYQSVYFKASVIAFPLSIGYQIIHKSRLRLNASLGVSILLLHDNKQYQLINNQYQTIDNETRLTFSLFGELEAEWKRKISVFAGDYLPTHVGNYAYYVPLHSSVKFGLRYNFF
jgi:hypothetical protein